MHGEFRWTHSTTSAAVRLKFNVAGTDVGPTNGINDEAHNDGNGHLAAVTWVHTVQSGDISGGTVTVKPRFATSASTLTVYNNTTNGLPLFTVKNWRQ